MRKMSWAKTDFYALKANGYSTQLRNFTDGCKGETSCIAEVAGFFGVANAVLPAWVPKPTFETSPAYALFNPLVAGQICKDNRAQRSADKC
jgi:hypothetical protein